MRVACVGWLPRATCCLLGASAPPESGLPLAASSWWSVVAGSCWADNSGAQITVWHVSLTPLALALFDTPPAHVRPPTSAPGPASRMWRWMRIATWRPRGAGPLQRPSGPCWMHSWRGAAGKKLMACCQPWWSSTAMG